MIMLQVEDYLHPEGKISLLREETPSTRTDSSLLSSLYSYWLLSNDSGQGGGGGSKNLSPSEIKARKAALKCVKVSSLCYGTSSSASDKPNDNYLPANGFKVSQNQQSTPPLWLDIGQTVIPSKNVTQP